MKCYCKNCKAEFYSNFRGKSDPETERTDCWNCGSPDSLWEIPAYETVAAWEARTGRKYSDTAPVYYTTAFGWELCSYRFWKKYTEDGQLSSELPLIVATEAGAPPDNWRPELPPDTPSPTCGTCNWFTGEECDGLNEGDCSV